MFVVEGVRLGDHRFVEALVLAALVATDRRVQRQFLSCGFVEYFCAAKPQNRDLKTVQGAKRLVLQRLVS